MAGVAAPVALGKSRSIDGPALLCTGERGVDPRGSKYDSLAPYAMCAPSALCGIPDCVRQLAPAMNAPAFLRLNW